MKGTYDRSRKDGRRIRGRGVSTTFRPTDVNRPALSLAASSAVELRQRVAAIDITVPHVTEGRTAQHREQYAVARMLATFAEAGLWQYPLSVDHRDKPDFALNTKQCCIGIECVEAVPEEWYEIQAIRERHFPDKLNFGQIFRAGQRRFTSEEKWAIASGEKKGPPWAGDMAERNWAEAIEYFVAQKTAKLRSGNYAVFSEMWLVVQDEWRVPIYYPEELNLAVILVTPKLAAWLRAPAYSRVFVCRSQTVITFTSLGVTFTPVLNLWHDG